MNQKKLKLDKKIRNLILSTLIGVILAVSYLYYDKNKTNPDFTKEMSAEQQTSLIMSEIEAVKNNTKPKEVIGALEPRMKMLSSENKELAIDLIYTSMQNSSLYYNTLTQVFAGEINYSRGDTKNSIDSALHNKIIDGYLKELKEQKIEYYNLNRDFFVSLPDFNYLDKYKNSMSKELKLLVEAGKIGQNSSIFEKDKVNSYNALKAYNQIVQKLYELKNINEKSKYLQDISSLARFYHDVAFGYVQTNNTELNSVHYNVSRDQIEQLERAKREFKDTPDFYKEIEDYLSKIKDGKIGADFIKDQSDNSVKKFGTSVYWNSVADITSLQTQNNK